MEIGQLNKAYEALNMLKSIGIEPSVEQLRAVRQMEQSYLEEEIIPLLSSELEPLFNKIRNDIKLDFTYSPDGGVSIKPYVPVVAPASTRSNNSESSRTRRKLKYKIRVIFPDNTSSCKVPVLETLMDVVRYAKPERVQALNIMIMEFWEK